MIHAPHGARLAHGPGADAHVVVHARACARARTCSIAAAGPSMSSCAAMPERALCERKEAWTMVAAARRAFISLRYEFATKDERTRAWIATACSASSSAIDLGARPGL